MALNTSTHQSATFKMFNTSYKRKLNKHKKQYTISLVNSYNGEIDFKFKNNLCHTHMVNE